MAMRRDRKLLSPEVARVGTETTGANGTTPSLTTLLVTALASVTVMLIASPAFAVIVELKLPFAATATPAALAPLVSLRRTSVIGAVPEIAPAVPATVAVVAPRVTVRRRRLTCGGAAMANVSR